MSEQLSRCPCCGGVAAPDKCEAIDFPTEWYVTCSVCKLATADYKTRTEAIAAWNRRAPEPEQGRVVTLKGHVDKDGGYLIEGAWDNWSGGGRPAMDFTVLASLPEYQPPPVVRARTEQSNAEPE